MHEMGQSLEEIAQKLLEVFDRTDKKVQLIYAFNGVGKTRLSRKFKELVSPKIVGEEEENTEKGKLKVLYYNAFTEDLFYWYNDLKEDRNRKFLILPNKFTDWVLKDQGQELKIVSLFQHYINNDKLTAKFNEEYIAKDDKGIDIVVPAYSEITFSISAGNETTEKNIKISKGEESCFIWCVFYSLLELVIETLNIAEEDERETDQFNELNYVYIDDPVSSLDENHLIEMAVNISTLIKKSVGIKYIISTHNPLFYNVLYNELGLKQGCLLQKNDDGTFKLDEKKGSSNKCFSYHLFLKQLLEDAVKTNSVQRFHFTLLRNLYEKTACFLGYTQWSDLLPDDKQVYYTRIMNFSSHSTLSDETVAELMDRDKNTLKILLEEIDKHYYKEVNNGAV